MGVRAHRDAHGHVSGERSAGSRSATLWRTDRKYVDSYMKRRERALIVGWRGGVGTALLGLLSAHPAGRRISDALDDLVLPGGRLEAADLDRLIREQGITQVIEISDVDTLEFSKVCAKHGADHVTATIQTGDVET